MTIWECFDQNPVIPVALCATIVISFGIVYGTEYSTKQGERTAAIVKACIEKGKSAVVSPVTEELAECR